MYRSFKNTIIKSSVVALVLSAGIVTNANAMVTRLSGQDRYSTSDAIVKSGWADGAETAVLASGLDANTVDALTVAPLAKSKNAPVVLVNPADSVQTIVAKFVALNTKTVYIASGTGVISTQVEEGLKSAGIVTVIRLGGINRYETALNIAKSLTASTSIVVANGEDAHLVDSLSIAPIAAAKGMPIFLTSSSLDPATAAYINSLKATTTYVLGGTGVVSDESIKTLPGVTRLAGSGRYETNAKIVDTFKTDVALDLTNIFVASGEDANLIDALAGAPLAALKKAPIIFVHDTINSDVNTLLSSVVNKTTTITELGGLGAVTKSADDAINALATFAAANKKGYVHNPELQTDLNVRATPSLTGVSQGYLYNYQMVEILDTIEGANNNVWDKIIYNNDPAYVSDAYIQPYTSPADNVVTVAKNITKQFEAATPNQIAGNFDGQGLSLGYLQWCIGAGTLQPILNRMDRQYNAEMKSIFGTNYDSIHNMIVGTENQNDWLKKINDSSNNIIEPWHSEFVSLCTNAHFISIEADAEVYMVKQAMIICDNYHLKTVRGFALAFDIAVQNGSISPDAKKIIDTAANQTPNMTEKALLGVIANAVADTSSTISKDDIRSRKLAIVNGQGTVHNSLLNLDTNYGLDDISWR